METIRIGTRGSKLALWQAEHIASLLETGGIKSEIVKIETKGDKILDVSIAKIGSKGVFTEEIEEQLKQGKIDIAVHSAKDLQSELPKGFKIIAFTTREIPNDVMISNQKIDIHDSSRTWVIGTSSTRRIACLKHFHPQLTTKEVRGNLQTRIRKLNEGQYDALMLAYAGVKRMGYESMICEELSTEDFIPAVGQGSIAIEIFENLAEEKIDLVKKLLNDPIAESCLKAERAYLRKLQGGCSIPVFGLASKTDEHTVSLTGGIISLDGSERIVFNLTDKVDNAEALGTALGEKVLNAGGDRILETIKKQI